MRYVLDVFIKRTFLLCICILNKTRAFLSPFSMVILCSHVFFTQRWLYYGRGGYKVGERQTSFIFFHTYYLKIYEIIYFPQEKVTYRANQCLGFNFDADSDPHWKKMEPYPDPGQFFKIYWIFWTKNNFQIFCLIFSPLFLS